MIKVVGFGDRSDLYLKAAHLLVKVVGISKLLEDKKLTIINRKMARKYFGYFHIPYHYSIKEKIRKNFSISISKVALKELGFLIMLHELLHLKQYLKGESICLHSTNNKPAVAYWKGKNLGRVSKIKYNERPWEIDVDKKMAYYSNKIIDKIIS
jgi:hypothetical protein